MNKLKRHFVILGKAVISGSIAFAILSGFCLLYDNMPQVLLNKDGTPTNCYMPDTFWANWREGFASGRTNNEGHMSVIDYTSDMPVDILITGSSQMEAKQVNLTESTAGRLNDLLPEKTVYNVGFSGNKFLKCSRNLEDSIYMYCPRDYVVMETSDLLFPEEELRAAIDGANSDSKDMTDGLLGWLRSTAIGENHFLELVYHQINNFRSKETAAETIDDEWYESAQYEKTVDVLLHKIFREAESTGAKVIIIYHPIYRFAPDGSLVWPDDHEASVSFAQACKKNGIIFLDMTERFQTEYENNHVFAYGFVNTSVEHGHLNKDGHAMIADELCKIISDKDNTDI